MSAKTTFFKDKDEYLAFRRVWGYAVNSPQARSRLIPKQSEGTGKQRVPGWITASHVILYNYLRDKPLDHGFTDITHKNKLINGSLVNAGVYHSYQALMWHLYHPYDSFLAPFYGTITPEKAKEIGATLHKANLMKPRRYVFP